LEPCGTILLDSPCTGNAPSLAPGGGVRAVHSTAPLCICAAADFGALQLFVKLGCDSIAGISRNSNKSEAGDGACLMAG
jgi:hypothetical protein